MRYGPAGLRLQEIIVSAPPDFPDDAQNEQTTGGLTA
jgi:hypothetical protein